MNIPESFNPHLPSIVLGGGGTFGMGVEAGYLDEFKERGADFKDAQIIGTSAGSWVGGFVATEKTFEEITNKVKKVRVPNRQPGYLRDIAEEIFADERASNVSAMAVRLPSAISTAAATPGKRSASAIRAGMWTSMAVPRRTRRI